MKSVKMGVWLCASVLGVWGSSAYAACDYTIQVCALQVLIAQNSIDPTNAAAMTQLQNMVNLAPNLTQLQLRIEGPFPSDTTPLSGPPQYTTAQMQSTVALITAIRQMTGVSPTLEIGFHPDNSKHSESTWGCAAGDVECVFSNTILLMNDINATLAANKVKGVGIFSIEQSYLEPQDSNSVALQKQCLQGKVVQGVCTVAATPAVTYGYVSPSCGDPGLYGSAYFDYGYPQMYNLIANWLGKPASPPLPVVDFPAQTVAAGTAYSLVDAIPPAGMPQPANVVPEQLGAPQGDIHSVYEPNVLASGVDAADAAQIVATVLVNKYGTTMSDNTCGTGNVSKGIRYFAFSGEPEFLGGSYDPKNPSAGWYWTKQDLVTFFNDLTADLQAQGVDASNLHFAIWSFDTMLLDGPGAA